MMSRVSTEFLKYAHKYAGRICYLICIFMQRYAILCNNMQLHRFAYPDDEESEKKSKRKNK